MEPVVVQVSMEETEVTSEMSSVSIRRLEVDKSKFQYMTFVKHIFKYSVSHPNMQRGFSHYF